MRLEEARKALDTYHGDHDVLKLENFVKTFERYAQTTNLRTDEERFEALGFKLKDRAATWWNRVISHLQELPQNEDSSRWPAFLVEFRKEFYPINWLREQYRRWRCMSPENSGSTLKFLRSFRTAMESIEVVARLHEEEKWRMLTSSLEQADIDFLDLQKINTTYAALEALTSRAAGQEKAEQRRRQPSGHKTVKTNAMKRKADNLDTSSKRRNCKVA